MRHVRTRFSLGATAWLCDRRHPHVNMHGQHVSHHPVGREVGHGVFGKFPEGWRLGAQRLARQGLATHAGRQFGRPSKGLGASSRFAHGLILGFFIGGGGGQANGTHSFDGCMLAGVECIIVPAWNPGPPPPHPPTQEDSACHHRISFRALVLYRHAGAARMCHLGAGRTPAGSRRKRVGRRRLAAAVASMFPCTRLWSVTGLLRGVTGSAGRRLIFHVRKGGPSLGCLVPGRESFWCQFSIVCALSRSTATFSDNVF